MLNSDSVELVLPTETMGTIALIGQDGPHSLSRYRTALISWIDRTPNKKPPRAERSTEAVRVENVPKHNCWIITNEKKPPRRVPWRKTRQSGSEKTKGTNSHSFNQVRENSEYWQFPVWRCSLEIWRLNVPNSRHSEI